ncbi:MAG: GGDEF domain-containing protein [Rubrobacteridae bacterium]|nr:GGDEF domain-containing protein [Rubrobacteridae bacterium]
MAFAIISIGIKLFVSIKKLIKELQTMIETESYDCCLDKNEYLLLGSLVESISLVLDQIEDKNKKVDEMSNIIDQREQENQLLWLEIEHNLCLAKEEAETDGLTKLYNRKSIEERFTAELDKAKSEGNPLSVLMADLDHFKTVNDTYGHKAGDEVLKIFAETLRSSTRSDDVPARYGGEEFIIILTNTPADIAIRVAERINEAFEKAVDENLGEKYNGLKCTVSIGVADFPACAKKKGRLVSAADIALYKAKEEGRNRVVYYGEVIDQLDKIA